MGETPVTQAQWQAVAALPKINRKLDPNPSHFKGNMRPVEMVSVPDAREFCDRLSQLTNKNFRLPTEAEWEYACRAGTTTRYSFGEEILSKSANYQPHILFFRMGGKIASSPVDLYHMNPWGLYDMHGNVWEWCQDKWHLDYEGSPSDGSAWNDNYSQAHVIRGGSFATIARCCRSASRWWNPANSTHYDLGFRVACDLT
jgi:formylglycine-generating enzyme required for sulfatase activity